MSNSDFNFLKLGGITHDTNSFTFVVKFNIFVSYHQIIHLKNRLELLCALYKKSKSERPKLRKTKMSCNQTSVKNTPNVRPCPTFSSIHLLRKVRGTSTNTLLTYMVIATLCTGDHSPSTSASDVTQSR